MNDAVLTGDKSMAEAFNKSFASVFGPRQGAHVTPIEIFRGHEDEKLKTVFFSSEDVTRRLKSLKPTSAPGPDGIHPRLLKECANELGQPLSIIFNRSMEEGILPDDWKKTNVTPIFKKGKRSHPENYRPVNLASVPSKIMEAIIKEHSFASTTWRFNFPITTRVLARQIVHVEPIGVHEQGHKFARQGRGV